MRLGNRRKIVVVSGDLGLRGGGTAAVGRLISQVCTGFALDRGYGAEVLNLGLSAPPIRGVNVRSYGGSQGALAVAVLLRQYCGTPCALVFDHLGPARVQSFLTRARRSPYLVFLHGIEVWRRLEWDRRRALARADIRLANSQYTRRRATENCPWLPPTEVLHLALETREPCGAVDRGLVAALGSGYLLTVGRMAQNERYKGHDEVLEALAGFAVGSASVELVIAGDGDDRSRLQAKAVSLGLNGRVNFVGFVNEATLRELYARCRALVMPSRNEGFGLVYLEAMRAGRPCLALRCSAAEEIIDDGITGVLVESGSKEQLKGALAHLLRNDAMVKRLGEAGRRRYETRFTFEAFRAGLSWHLERLLGWGGDDDPKTIT